MPTPLSTGLLAIDIGNSRVKLGWYAPRDTGPNPSAMGLLPGGPTHARSLPMPDRQLALEGGSENDPRSGELLSRWLDALPLSSARCLISSVQSARLERMLGQLASDRLDGRLLPPHVLRHDDLPLAIRTDQPEQVGIDRLLNGVSANYLRQPEQPAIIVDMGSAITVDRVAVDGAFEGGAILPGLALSAHALQTETDLLPRISLSETQQPAVVGKNTTAAMAAGLYWGAVGAVREIIRLQMAEGDLPCELFLTGGDAMYLAGGLRFRDRMVHYQEQMVLAGIWLVGQQGS